MRCAIVQQARGRKISKIATSPPNTIMRYPKTSVDPSKPMSMKTPSNGPSAAEPADQTV
jgi:hypothetical protein